MDLKNKNTQESIIKNWLSIPLSLKEKIYLIYCESENKLILKRLAYRKGDSILEREKNLQNLKIYKDIFDLIFDFLVKENEKYPNIYLKKITSFEQNLNF